MERGVHHDSSGGLGRRPHRTMPPSRFLPASGAAKYRLRRAMSAASESVSRSRTMASWGDGMNALHVFFDAERGWIHNLGDALVPHLLGALGFRCVTRSASSRSVLNPGRCLLVIGSLLTSADLRRIGGPIDIWGCGWKGAEAIEGFEGDLSFHAVRGPLTAAGLCPGGNVAVGDPALLVPYLFPRTPRPHGRTLLLQHLDRVESAEARRRAVGSGCDEVRSPFVYAAVGWDTFGRVPPGMVLRDLRRWWRLRRPGVHSLWATLDRIAGADFVLTGSLHGAILAQAYGVPWAAYDDGCVDSPSKWRDWGAYVGVPVSFTRSLDEGREWWRVHGKAARIRDLAPLVRAFPYLGFSPPAQRLLADLEASA